MSVVFRPLGELVEYSTSIQWGSAINRFAYSIIPDPLKGLGGRFFSTLVTYGAPVYATVSGLTDKYPLLRSINPIINNRVFYSGIVNAASAGLNMVGAIGYKVIYGEDYKAGNHFNLFKKFAWRAACEIAAYRYISEPAFTAIAIGEGTINLICPSLLETVTKKIAGFFDSFCGNTDKVPVQQVQAPVEQIGEAESDESELQTTGYHLDIPDLTRAQTEIFTRANNLRRQGKSLYVLKDAFENSFTKRYKDEISDEAQLRFYISQGFEIRIKDSRGVRMPLSSYRGDVSEEEGSSPIVPRSSYQPSLSARRGSSVPVTAASTASVPTVSSPVNVPRTGSKFFIKEAARIGEE